MQENTQFQRTDKAIKQALITLLKTTPFEKITVQDILDETPVTRSTFYKHFHDKYEIVERMQDEFFAAQMELRISAHKNPQQFHMNMISLSRQNHELLQALLKVHTEKVDIRSALAKQSADYYLNTTNSPTAEIEAEIFSQALTAFQLSYHSSEIFSFEHMHGLYINVFLKLLGIPDDEETRKLLSKKAIALPAPPDSNNN